MPTHRFALALALSCLPTLVASGADDNKIPADVQAALDKAESFELYSLDPSREPGEPGKDEEKKDDTTKFQGWKVLGKTTVAKEDRAKLVTALQDSVKENTGIVAACFIPRHGIRVKHDKKVFDIVICFQCFSANTFVDDQRSDGFLVTGTPQPAFDKVLKDAKVPLPKGSKE